MYESDEDDSNSDHPNRSKRLEAIERGYNKAIGRRTLVKIDPAPSAEKFYNDGNDLYKIKKFQEALEKFTAAIALKPNYANAYNNRGLVKVQLKDTSGAIADYTKAIELKPNMALLIVTEALQGGN